MSLAKRVVPLILCKGHVAVKGQRFQPWRSIGTAKQVISVHARRGVDEIILVDVAATAEGRGPDLELVRQLSEDCYVPITVGGGVKTLNDIDALLRAGADKVAICTAAFRSQEFDLLAAAAGRFGSQAIVAVVDYWPHLLGKTWGEESFCALHCGAQPALSHPVLLSKEYAKRGAGEIMLQCVERDGMMQGYDLDLIRTVTQAVDVPVIASCGAGTYEHMHEALQAGADAVAAGAMFAFTDQTPKGAAQYLKAKGWEMRT